jgi:hypothetical protein
LCDGAPIFVITIHLCVSVHKSEIDRDLEDLIRLRQPVIPSAGSTMGFWSYVFSEVYNVLLSFIQHQSHHHQTPDHYQDSRICESKPCSDIAPLDFRGNGRHKLLESDRELQHGGLQDSVLHL